MEVEVEVEVVVVEVEVVLVVVVIVVVVVVTVVVVVSVPTHILSCAKSNNDPFLALTGAGQLPSEQSNFPEITILD